MSTHNTDIYNFMCNNHRFINAGYERRWNMLNPDGSKKGMVYFKHSLGGWRLLLDTDRGYDSQERGVIENVEQLKKYLED
jgi:hypothetical protein